MKVGETFEHYTGEIGHVCIQQTNPVAPFILPKAIGIPVALDRINVFAPYDIEILPQDEFVIVPTGVYLHAELPNPSRARTIRIAGSGLYVVSASNDSVEYGQEICVKIMSSRVAIIKVKKDDPIAIITVFNYPRS